MYCPSCGDEQSADASYCMECGADLSASPEAFDSGQQTNPGDGSGAPPDGAVATSTERQATSAEVSTSTGWTTSRKVAVGGAVIAGLSVFLPWVEAVTGGVSASGMSTEIGPVAIVAAIIALIPALLTWGRGFGWLSMIITGLAGVGIAGVSLLVMSLTSETATIGRMSVEGQLVPLAALQPAVGIYVTVLGGAVITLAALGGIAGTLTSS